MDDLDQTGPSRRTRGSRMKAVDNITRKFLDNFDPEQSEREKRKLNRRINPGNKKAALYDERGFYMTTGEDICDCLQKICPGCHFPCPKCNSTKCGHECRNNRKWAYDTIENEGSDSTVKNHYSTH